MFFRLGQFDLLNFWMELSWLEFNIRYSSFGKLSSGSSPWMRLWFPDTLVSSGIDDRNKLLISEMSLWSNQKISSLGRFIRGISLILVLTILKKTKLLRSDLAIFPMSENSLRLISMAVREGNFITGSAPLILLLQMKAISSSLMPKMAAMDSTWLSRMYTSVTPVNLSNRSMFLILFSHRLRIWMSFLFSMVSRSSMSGSFFEVSSRKLDCSLLVYQMVFQTSLRSKQFQIQSQFSMMSTMRASLLCWSMTAITSMIQFSFRISYSQLHSLLTLNFRQFLRSYKVFLSHGFRAIRQFQQKVAWTGLVTPLSVENASMKVFLYLLYITGLWPTLSTTICRMQGYFCNSPGILCCVALELPTSSQRCFGQKNLMRFLKSEPLEVYFSMNSEQFLLIMITHSGQMEVPQMGQRRQFRQRLYPDLNLVHIVQQKGRSLFQNFIGVYRWPIWQVRPLSEALTFWTSSAFFCGVPLNEMSL